MMMIRAGRWLMVAAVTAGAVPGVAGVPVQASAWQLAPPARAVLSSTLPPDRVPSLSGVSCPSVSRCIAVGDIFRPAAGLRDDFSSSLIWNGRSWRLLRTPGTASLAAVSCATAVRCVAVGRQAALAWNGTRWRTLKLAPKPGQTITLTGVSCQAASRCVAVGFWGSMFTAGGTVAELWNGTRWRLLATPDPAGAVTSSLAGISCASAAQCVAVGAFTSDLEHPLAESWNGHRWTILAPADWTGGLTAVSCPAISRCMAVGQPANVAADATLAQEWDGTSWRLLTTADDGFTILDGVSCTSATACIAAGEAFPAGVGNGDVPLAEQWDGASWRLLKTVAPGADVIGNNALDSVSCPRPARCMAVGTAASAGSLAEEWDGTRWSVHRTNHTDALLNISCTRISRCLAAGAFINRADELAVLAETWNGRRWHLVHSPGLGELTALSCLSARHCVAVGSTPDRVTPLALAWNGRTWHVMPTASLPLGQLRSVSCTSPSFCIATGFAAQVARWDGHSWQPAAFTVPAHSGLTLNAVSCTSQKRCMAVGLISRGRIFVPRTLAAAWNGTSWRILATPNRSQSDNELTAVSCTRQACMTVGDYVVRSAGGHTAGHSLALRWTGTRWRIVKIGGPAGLQSVSCPAASACLAAGNFLAGNRSGGLSGHNLAQVWNGRTWRIIRTAGPGGGLASVSCARPRRCMAIGQARILTMAQIWNGQHWRLLTTPSP